MRLVSLIIGISFIILIGFFALPWVVIAIGMSSIPSPPIPEITYGEFPFKLEYSIDGELFQVEDILICCYDGIGMNEGLGKYRKWESSFASGNEMIVLYETVGLNELFHEAETLYQVKNEDDFHTAIYFNPGSASYLMGDEGMPSNFPNAEYIVTNKGDIIKKGVIRAADLLNNYGIILTEWEISSPLINQFN